MKNHFVKFVPAVLVSCSLMMYGCEKDSDSLPSSSLLTDDAYIQFEYDAVDATVTNSMIENADGLRTSEECATISIDVANKRMTIDFGQSGCEGVDGRVRKGKIYVDYTGPITDFGASTITSFDNFYVDNNKLEGSRIRTNNGPNADGHLVFTTVLSEGKITLSDGKTILREGVRETVWKRGTNPNLDVYEITGTSSGTTRDGVQYVADITKKLVRKMECRENVSTSVPNGVPIPFPVSGTIEITPSGSSARSIDYGNGDCDDKATVTINGFSFEITLVRRPQ